MIKLILALSLMVGSASAYEQTDYTCMNQCQGAGMMYQLCKKKCTYDSAPAAPSSRTDYGCVNDCTGTGLSRNLCMQKCSY